MRKGLADLCRRVASVLTAVAITCRTSDRTNHPLAQNRAIPTLRQSLTSGQVHSAGSASGFRRCLG